MSEKKVTPATQKLLNCHRDTVGIVSINDKVYVAVGYDASYMSMIVGDDGIVLVDTGANPYAAASVMSMFRKITDKPLKAIIYTHSHVDHIGGAGGIVSTEGTPEIWARAGFGCEDNLMQLMPHIVPTRIFRQFGNLLPPERRVMPLGPAAIPDPGKDWKIVDGRIAPTNLFSENVHVLDIAGLHLELQAAPGETSDQLNVWMPEEKILFVGDNMYASFPNLYAVRGAGYRDVAVWAASVRKARDLQPETVVMGHTSPLLDAKTSHAWLDNYQAAIQYVFDATIKGMDEGRTEDELAAEVALPAELASLPYLQELYGNISFSVRSIFGGHFGWFDGQAYKLVPLTPKEEAEHIVALGGGAQKVLETAQKAYAEEDYKWAAKLAAQLLELDGTNAEYRQLMGNCLDELAQTLSCTTGRNYINSCALEFHK